MRTCPNCKNQVSENAIFCDQCGSKLPTEEPVVQDQVAEAPTGSVPKDIVICPSCGAENVPGEMFCDLCGEPLEAPAPIEAGVEEVAMEEAVVEEVAAEEVAVEEVAVEEVAAEEVVVEEVAVEEVAAEEPIVEAVVVEETAAGELYCAVCGSVVSAGDTFCGSCGAALGGMAVEEATIVEEPIIEEEIAIEEEPIIEEEIAIVEEPIIEEETAIVEEAAAWEAVTEEPVIEEAVLEEIEEPPAVETTAQVLRCAVCGEVMQPGQAFCASCGAAQQAPGAAVQVEPEVVTTGPYLEIVDSGAHIPLVSQPELLVGRLDEASGIEPEIDMTPHGGLDGGVSRRHAKLLYEGAAWFVVDLDSTNGTFINGEEVLPKIRTALSDGDKIEFGEVAVIFHAG